ERGRSSERVAGHNGPLHRPSFIEANGVTLHCAEAGPANGPLSSFCTAFPNSGSLVGRHDESESSAQRSDREARTGATGPGLKRPKANILQAEPNPDQAGPRKWAWIVLDFFVRFGAFQWVTSAPKQKNSGN